MSQARVETPCPECKALCKVPAGYTYDECIARGHVIIEGSPSYGIERDEPVERAKDWAEESHEDEEGA